MNTDRFRTQTHRPTRALALLVAAATLLLSGCGGEERSYPLDEVRDVAKTRVPSAPGATGAQRFDTGGHGRRAPEAADPSTGRPTWRFDLPKGWKELPPKPMRDLGFQVAGRKDSECSFSILGGTGGGLEANVNRWRRQMGLEAMPAEAIAELPRQTWLGLEAVRVDFEGAYGGMGGQNVIANARMLGLIAMLPRQAVFLKMTGPADVVAKEVTSFDSFAVSLKPGPPARTAEMPAGHGQRPPAEMPAGHGQRRGPFTWDVPEGWEKKADRAMRIVTLAPRGSQDVECYVSILRGDGGGLAANINRWRTQMGQPALSAAEIEALPRLKALDGDGPVVEIEGNFSGQGGEKVQKAGLLGYVLMRPNDAVFIKMTGPSDVVSKERPRFEAFVKSLAE